MQEKERERSNNSNRFPFLRITPTRRPRHDWKELPVSPPASPSRIKNLSSNAISLLMQRERSKTEEIMLYGSLPNSRKNSLEISIRDHRGLTKMFPNHSISHNLSNLTDEEMRSPKVQGRSHFKGVSSDRVKQVEEEQEEGSESDGECSPECSPDIGNISDMRHIVLAIDCLESIREIDPGTGIPAGSLLQQAMRELVKEFSNLPANYRLTIFEKGTQYIKLLIHEVDPQRAADRIHFLMQEFRDFEQEEKHSRNVKKGVGLMEHTNRVKSRRTSSKIVRNISTHGGHGGINQNPHTHNNNNIPSQSFIENLKLSRRVLQDSCNIFEASLYFFQLMEGGGRRTSPHIANNIWSKKRETMTIDTPKRHLIILSCGEHSLYHFGGKYDSTLMQLSRLQININLLLLSPSKLTGCQQGINIFPFSSNTVHSTNSHMRNPVHFFFHNQSATWNYHLNNRKCDHLENHDHGISLVNMLRSTQSAAAATANQKLIKEPRYKIFTYSIKADIKLIIQKRKEEGFTILTQFYNPQEIHFYYLLSEHVIFYYTVKEVNFREAKDIKEEAEEIREVNNESSLSEGEIDQYESEEKETEYIGGRKLEIMVSIKCIHQLTKLMKEYKANKCKRPKFYGDICSFSKELKYTDIRIEEASNVLTRNVLGGGINSKTLSPFFANIKEMYVSNWHRVLDVHSIEIIKSFRLKHILKMTPKHMLRTFTRIIYIYIYIDFKKMMEESLYRVTSSSIRSNNFFIKKYYALGREDGGFLVCKMRWISTNYLILYIGSLGLRKRDLTEFRVRLKQELQDLRKHIREVRTNSRTRGIQTGEEFIDILNEPVRLLLAHLPDYSHADDIIERAEEEGEEAECELDDYPATIINNPNVTPTRVNRRTSLEEALSPKTPHNNYGQLFHPIGGASVNPPKLGTGSFIISTDNNSNTYTPPLLAPTTSAATIMPGTDPAIYTEGPKDALLKTKISNNSPGSSGGINYPGNYDSPKDFLACIREDYLTSSIYTYIPTKGLRYQANYRDKEYYYSPHPELLNDILRSIIYQRTYEGFSFLHTMDNKYLFLKRVPICTSNESHGTCLCQYLIYFSRKVSALKSRIFVEKSSQFSDICKPGTSCPMYVHTIINCIKDVDHQIKDLICSFHISSRQTMEEMCRKESPSIPEIYCYFKQSAFAYQYHEIYILKFGHLKEHYYDYLQSIYPGPPAKPLANSFELFGDNHAQETVINCMDNPGESIDPRIIYDHSFPLPQENILFQIVPYIEILHSHTKKYISEDLYIELISQLYDEIHFILDAFTDSTLTNFTNLDPKYTNKHIFTKSVSKECFLSFCIEKKEAFIERVKGRYKTIRSVSVECEVYLVTKGIIKPFTNVKLGSPNLHILPAFEQSLSGYIQQISDDEEDSTMLEADYLAFHDVKFETQMKNIIVCITNLIIKDYKQKLANHIYLCIARNEYIFCNKLIIEDALAHCHKMSFNLKMTVTTTLMYKLFLQHSSKSSFAYIGEFDSILDKISNSFGKKYEDYPIFYYSPKSGKCINIGKSEEKNVSSASSVSNLSEEEDSLTGTLIMEECGGRLKSMCFEHPLFMMFEAKYEQEGSLCRKSITCLSDMIDKLQLSQNHMQIVNHVGLIINIYALGKIESLGEGQEDIIEDLINIQNEIQLEDYYDEICGGVNRYERAVLNPFYNYADKKIQKVSTAKDELTSLFIHKNEFYGIEFDRLIVPFQKNVFGRQIPDFYLDKDRDFTYHLTRGVRREIYKILKKTKTFGSELLLELISNIRPLSSDIISYTRLKLGELNSNSLEQYTLTYELVDTPTKGMEVFRELYQSLFKLNLHEINNIFYNMSNSNHEFSLLQPKKLLKKMSINININKENQFYTKRSLEEGSKEQEMDLNFQRTRTLTFSNSGTRRHIRANTNKNKLEVDKQKIGINSGYSSDITKSHGEESSEPIGCIPFWTLISFRPDSMEKNAISTGIAIYLPDYKTNIKVIGEKNYSTVENKYIDVEYRNPQDILCEIKEHIKDTFDNVWRQINQIILLRNLNETRNCSDLLFPLHSNKESESIVLQQPTKSRSKARYIANFAARKSLIDFPKNIRPIKEKKEQFEQGEFVPECQREYNFGIKERFQKNEGLRGVATKFDNTFSIYNREYMYALKDGIHIFVVQFSEEMMEREKEKGPIPSPSSPFSVAMASPSSFSSATTSKVPDSPLRPCQISPEDAPSPTNAERILKMKIYGIRDPSHSFFTQLIYSVKEQLTQTTLLKIADTHAKNLYLSLYDYKFLNKAHHNIKLCFHLPNGIEDEYAFMRYFIQSLRRVFVKYQIKKDIEDNSATILEVNEKEEMSKKEGGNFVNNSEIGESEIFEYAYTPEELAVLYNFRVPLYMRRTKTANNQHPGNGPQSRKPSMAPQVNVTKNPREEYTLMGNVFGKALALIFLHYSNVQERKCSVESIVSSSSIADTYEHIINAQPTKTFSRAVNLNKYSRKSLAVEFLSLLKGESDDKEEGIFGILDKLGNPNSIYKSVRNAQSFGEKRISFPLIIHSHKNESSVDDKLYKLSKSSSFLNENKLITLEAKVRGNLQVEFFQNFLISFFNQTIAEYYTELLFELILVSLSSDSLKTQLLMKENYSLERITNFPEYLDSVLTFGLEMHSPMFQNMKKLINFPFNSETNFIAQIIRELYTRFKQVIQQTNAIPKLAPALIRVILQIEIYTDLHRKIIDKVYILANAQNNLQLFKFIKEHIHLPVLKMRGQIIDWKILFITKELETIELLFNEAPFTYKKAYFYDLGKAGAPYVDNSKFFENEINEPISLNINKFLSKLKEENKLNTIDEFHAFFTGVFDDYDDITNGIKKKHSEMAMRMFNKSTALNPIKHMNPIEYRSLHHIVPRSLLILISIKNEEISAKSYNLSQTAFDILENVICMNTFWLNTRYCLYNKLGLQKIGLIGNEEQREREYLLSSSSRRGNIGEAERKMSMQDAEKDGDTGNIMRSINNLEWMNVLNALIGKETTRKMTLRVVGGQKNIRKGTGGRMRRASRVGIESQTLIQNIPNAKAKGKASSIFRLKEDDSFPRFITPPDSARFPLQNILKTQRYFDLSIVDDLVPTHLSRYLKCTRISNSGNSPNWIYFSNTIFSLYSTYIHMLIARETASESLAIQGKTLLNFDKLLGREYNKNTITLEKQHPMHRAFQSLLKRYGYLGGEWSEENILPLLSKSNLELSYQIPLFFHQSNISSKYTTESQNYHLFVKELTNFVEDLMENITQGLGVDKIQMNKIENNKKSNKSQFDIYGGLIGRGARGKGIRGGIEFGNMPMSTGKRRGFSPKMEGRAFRGDINLLALPEWKVTKKPTHKHYHSSSGKGLEDLKRGGRSGSIQTRDSKESLKDDREVGRYFHPILRSRQKGLHESSRTICKYFVKGKYRSVYIVQVSIRGILMEVNFWSMTQLLNLSSMNYSLMKEGQGEQLSVYLGDRARQIHNIVKSTREIEDISTYIHKLEALSYDFHIHKFIEYLGNPRNIDFHIPLSDMFLYFLSYYGHPPVKAKCSIMGSIYTLDLGYVDDVDAFYAYFTSNSKRYKLSNLFGGRSDSGVIYKPMIFGKIVGSSNGGGKEESRMRGSSQYIRKNSPTPPFHSPATINKGIATPVVTPPKMNTRTFIVEEGKQRKGEERTESVVSLVSQSHSRRQLPASSIDSIDSVNRYRLSSGEYLQHMLSISSMQGLRKESDLSIFDSNDEFPQLQFSYYYVAAPYTGQNRLPIKMQQTTGLLKEHDQIYHELGRNVLGLMYFGICTCEDKLTKETLGEFKDISKFTNRELYTEHKMSDYQQVIREKLRAALAEAKEDYLCDIKWSLLLDSNSLQNTRRASFVATPRNQRNNLQYEIPKPHQKMFGMKEWIVLKCYSQKTPLKEYPQFKDLFQLPLFGAEFFTWLNMRFLNRCYFVRDEVGGGGGDMDSRQLFGGGGRKDNELAHSIYYGGNLPNVPNIHNASNISSGRRLPAASLRGGPVGSSMIGATAMGISTTFELRNVDNTKTLPTLLSDTHIIILPPLDSLNNIAITIFVIYIYIYIM